MAAILSSFLDAVEVKFGPKPQLARFFLDRAESFRNAGVSLHMARGLDRLVDVHRQNRQSWHPLIPSLDPAMSDITTENALYFEGQVDGEPVATLALRRYDWSGTCFRREWESGRFAYRDPASQMRPDEAWRAGAAMAEDVSGSAVVFCGGVWYRPDRRARGLATMAIQLAQGLALTTWNADHLFGLIETGAPTRALLPCYGHPAAEPGIRVTGAFRNLDLTLVDSPQEDLRDRVLNRLSKRPDHADQGNGRYIAVGGARTPA